MGQLLWFLHSKQPLIKVINLKIILPQQHLQATQGTVACMSGYKLWHQNSNNMFMWKALINLQSNASYRIYLQCYYIISWSG